MPIPELAEPKRTAPAAPAPIPGSSLLQAVDSNAQSLRAGASAPKSALLDTVGQDAEALRQYEDQKRRAMYGIPVSDDEYSLISSALALSQNPDEERWNWASAKMYSQRLGIPMESARANLESISQSWLQSPNITNGKSHFEAIADSFRIGDLTMDAANLAKQWKDTGGQDQDLERKIDALYGEMAQMQDRWPRSVIPTALKYGAESAPFMAQVLGKGAMAGGAAAAAVAVGTASMGGTASTFGLAAPVGAAAMASALTLAASQTGSFMASMQIMEALDYYDMRKKGVSHEIASPMAMVSGGVQATLESFLGNVPGLIGKVGGKTITGISGNIAKGLLISGKSGALGTALMGYGGEILEEGAEEALQSISSDVIKNIAYGLSGAGIAQTEADEIAKNAWDNFKGGALASLGYGLPGAFIGYKGAARQSKALKEYAGMTDRETFIEQAGKWNEIESVPEEHRKAALSKIWEQAQQKAKETREAVPEGEAKPFKRTESGDLYTEEITVDSAEEGKVEAILKVGDADSKERLGYLRYEITDDGIVLSDAHFSKGRDALRDEAILTLAAKYPGLPITAASGASEATQAAVDRLTAANPKGTGANWYAEGEDQNVAQARSKLRLAISDKMPNVSPAQREAAILMHEFRANAMGVRFDDYLKNEFSSEIIGTDMSRVSAAQGQRAGVLFTKGGQELRIGEFVRDAKALVMVTEKSDFVSFVHESGHMFRKQLIDTDLGKQLDEAYQIVGGTWTREHEERFVDDLVKYLSYGEVKDEKLRGVFSRIAEWITRLWDKVLNQADVDPRIRAVMDELFKSDVSPLQEAASTSAIASDRVSSTEASAVEQGGKEEVLFQEAPPTDSEAFKKWFGDSKVVDKTGQPLMVYHGTTRSFEAFDLSKTGEATLSEDSKGAFFFTTKPEVADDFAGYMYFTPDGENVEKSYSLGANIIPVYLKLENPAIWDMSGGSYKEGFIKAAIKDAKAKRKDGIVFTRMKDGSISTIGPWKESYILVVFDPSQIKSPFNKGAWNTEDSRLLFQTYTPSPKKDQLFDAVIAEHGTTKNLDEAGFILPDGRLVDLSGRNEDPDYKMVGDHYETKGGDYLSGKRLLAHADVRWSGSPQGARGFLVRQGAIRVDAKYGILEMDNEPTTEQLPWIRDVLSQGKEVGIEMHDGKRSGDIRGDDPKKTLGLIRRFYDGEDIGRVLFQTADPIDSPDFKEWFGDSKVVDADGNPLVVYHGSPDLRWLKEEGAFKSERERYGMGRDTHAHWFTPSLATAKTYANPHRAFDYQNAEEGVVSCYIKLENPLVIDAGGKEWRDAQKVGKTSDVIDRGRAGGHDGVIIRNVKDDYNNNSRTRPTDTYVVFSPAQAKAVDNRGTWDANDPRILFQTNIEAPEFQTWFEGSKVVDESGKPLVVYSGHSNVALYGQKYDPKKGSSGGFYATDSPELASSYATGKVGSQELYQHGDEYRIAGKNGQYNKKLRQVEITPELKMKIDEAISATDENGEYVHPIAEMERYIEENKRYDADVRRWSYSGGIYNLENIYAFYDYMGDTVAYNDSTGETHSNFDLLLNALGMDWNSYNKSQPGIMKLYMSIKNPLDSNKQFPLDLLSALEEAARRERNKVTGEHWSKLLSLSEWVEMIKTDTGIHGWATQVPLKAMPIIESFGYDGIIDTSGKGGEDKHGVYVAFYPGQIKSVFNRGTWDSQDDRMLFQLDDEIINAEALKYKSWEEWKSDEEATAEWIGDQARPGDLEGKDLDDWYRDRWEAARAKADETEAAARTEQRREARRGEFAATMAKADGVESLLREIWDAEVQAFDTAQASDEQESAEIDKAYEWKKELAQRLAGHPLVLLAAQSVGNGKKLKPSTRKAILAYVRNNEIEFAALYAELTGDLDLAQYAEAGRAKLQSIPDPRLDKYADMSIAERTALLNRVSDQEVRARIKAGELSDPEFVDYVRRLEETKKSLTKEAEDAKAEIEKLGGELENESDFAVKMYDRSKTAAKALESTQKELDKAKAAKERVEASKSAYVEALGSARDESRLSAKIAKKEYLAALNEARREAAFQARFVAAEIRATTKLRAQRDSLRRYIMKKPAKNIIWEKKQQIKTIQEYLRSKKWEYIEEQDEAGKIKRRRAYDTVVGDDGKTHKVPRYTTVQAENLQVALSMLLRESPNLKKLLTNGIVDRINEKPVTAWTVSELQDLREIIDRLAKEGREEYEIKRMMENREAASDRYDITRAIRENKRYKEPAARGSDEEKAIKKKMEGFATWELPAMKMRYFAPLLDGGTEGVNTKVLVHDEYAARREKQAQKVRRLSKVQTRMRELNLMQKERQRKITIAGIGPGATDVTMSAARLSHVALLLRNAKGRDAFIYGNLFSERERSSMNRDFIVANGDMKYRKLVAAIESNLTDAEKEIIDLVGKGFGGAEFDRQNKAVIELTNEEMKPEANYSPLYREGAYFDSQKDSIIETMKAKHGFVVNPESGFTIARINIAPEHQSPVRVMDIVAMFEDAVDTQEHLIAYGAYVKKLHSVYQNRMQSKAVREGIIQTFGKDGMKYIDEYIGAVSQPNADSGVNGPGNKALRKLRGYQAVGFLAYRWTSVVKQLITSPMPYMAYAPKETLASAFQAMGSGNMFKFIEQVEAKSGMLQSRTIDQIFEAIKTMDSEGWEGLVKKIGTVGMKGLEFADRVSVAIGWKGVYDKELSQGATEEEAVKKADDITFQTQPSANPADLAPIYRDMNEWKRILLMFTSSLNTVYNNIRHGVPKAIREKEYGQAVGIVTSYAVAGVLLGAFAKSLGKDPPPDDPDEWWRQWVFYSMTQFTDSVPLIGNEVSGVMKRMITKSKGTPFGEDTLPTVTAIISGFDSLNKGDIDKAAENFAEGVGLATGLPTLAIEEYAKNIGSLMEGE